MMLILNRLRGTVGDYAKAIGLLFALIIEMVYHNHYVTIAVGLGYIIGESFGWGLWLGSIAERSDGYSLYLKGEREGVNNGIHWLASNIVEPTKETWLNYCRVAMVIRGFYWYVLTITPLYFVGFSPYLLLGLIVFLSFGFMLSYELAYHLAPKLNIRWLEFNSGWTLGEGIVGLTQDIAIIILIVSNYVMAN